MNKLRLIKIYELRGNIHPIENFIINLLDGIEEDTSDSIIYYEKYGNIYFCYNTENYKIWTFSILDGIFSKQFNCTSDEIIEIMKYLLEKHLKITINIVW